MIDDNIGDYIQLFELLLLIHNWTSSDEFSQEDISILEVFLPMFMQTYKLLIDRQRGHGAKFIKLHLMSHLANDIFIFGSPDNFYGGIGEN